MVDPGIWFSRSHLGLIGRSAPVRHEACPMEQTGMIIALM